VQQIFLIPGDPALADSCSYSMEAYRESLNLSDEAMGAIQLCGFRQHIEQGLSGSVGGVSRANGRPKIGDIDCCKSVDGMTPVLLAHCLNGEPLGLGGYTTQVLICSAEGNRLNLLMGYRLSNAIITSFTTEIVSEQIKDFFTLNASAIEWFAPSKEDEGVVMGWDINNGKPLGR